MFISFVVKLFVYIYSFLGDILVEFYNFTFKYLYILDSDIRRDIFIGVTGLTIAIIIFIAEVISNKKYELEKKLILKKTGIKKNILFCIIIFFMMFLSLIFKSSYHKEVIEYYITCDIVYYLIQLVLNFLIIVYMVLAVRIFWIAVKLNTDSDYFGEELDKFLNKKTIDIEKNAYKQNIKGFKKLKREFDSFIKSNIHITNDSLSVAFSSELYSPIYPSRNGILKKYDYRTISTLLDALQLSKLDETNEYIDKEEIIIAFTKNIGDKINKNTPIAYCLKKYFKHFKELSNCIIIDSNSSYIGDEIRIINENFLEYSLNFKKPSNFDENDRLFNYFNHLYKNDLSGVKSIALEQLEVIARHLYMDDYKNRKFANFLNRLLSLSFSNDNYDDYSRINRLIGILYLERLKIENANVKEIAYNFSVHYFHVNYFSVKNMMSYVFMII